MTLFIYTIRYDVYKFSTTLGCEFSGPGNLRPFSALFPILAFMAFLLIVLAFPV